MANNDKKKFVVMYRVFSRWTNDEDIIPEHKLCDYGSWTVIEKLKFPAV